MLKKLSQNLLIKIISIAIASIIWLSVYNVMNPIVNDFMNVRVELVNEEEIYKINKSYIVHTPRTCKIDYKINADQSTTVRQSDFKAYVDLTDLFTTNELPIHVEALNDVDRYISNINVEPSTLHVEIDDIKRVELPVKYRTNGKLDEGHTIGSVIFSPNVVYVSGSNSAVKDLSHISIEIPVNNQEETFSGKTKARVIGVDGNELKIDGMELSATEINYTVTIFSRASVALNPIVEGNVKKGYTYAGAQVYPNAILLDGPRSAIENIYIIDLPLINIDDLSENTEYIFSINEILPAGFKCSSTNEIKVNVTINDNVLGPKG